MQHFKKRSMASLAILLSIGALASAVQAAGSSTTAQKSLPLKGGERVLFVGNSLTASLPKTLNEMFEANGLPTFEGYRLQIWNQTFETHWTIARETHPRLFHEEIPAYADGFAVKGATTLWKKGQYNDPKYTDRGFIYAAEAIRNGTPEGRPWDFVVLQGYRAHLESNNVTEGPDGQPVFEGPFLKYGALLIEEVKKAGAQPILYQAWLLNPEQGGGNEDPNSYYNQNFDRLIANCRALGEACDVPVVPVGAAMRALSRERKPAKARTAWLIRDNVHGSACGGALLHYCLGSALSGIPATELRYERVATNQWGQGAHYRIGEKENRYGLPITAQIDAAIKQAVRDFLEEYGFHTTGPHQSAGDSSASSRLPMLSTSSTTNPSFR
jgi:hypothetical protein